MPRVSLLFPSTPLQEPYLWFKKGHSLTELDKNTHTHKAIKICFPTKQGALQMPKARPDFGGTSKVCLWAEPCEEVLFPAPPSGSSTMRPELLALWPPLPGCKAQASLPCTQNTRQLALLASSRHCRQIPRLCYSPLRRQAGSWGALSAAAPKSLHVAPKPPTCPMALVPNPAPGGLVGGTRGVH